MTNELKVQSHELYWTANTLKSSWITAPVPSQPPSVLFISQDANEQLLANHDTLASYVEAGHTESIRLGEAFTSAAQAYEKTDPSGAHALKFGTTPEAAMPAGPSTPPSTVVDAPLPPRPDADSRCMDVEEVARQLQDGDQGASLRDYSAAWDKVGQALADRAGTFEVDKSLSWEGEAAEAANGKLGEMCTWLQGMQEVCSAHSWSATQIFKAHYDAVSEHPTLEEIQELKRLIDYNNSWVGTPMNANGHYSDERDKLQDDLAKKQRQSEEILQKYAKAASIDKISPTKPPAVAGMQTQGPGGNGTPAGGGGGGGGGMPAGLGGAPAMPTGMGQSGAPQQPAAKGGGAPSGGGKPQGGTPSGFPGGIPSPGTGTGTGTPNLPKGPSLKPAAAHGGGAHGGGGGGAPKMPLQPSVGGKSVAPSTAAAGAGPAAGDAGPGGAMGGGSGGGMPMGGRGGGEQGKAKRAIGDNEAVYKEDREWTEAVIGSRRAKNKDNPAPRETK